MGNPQALEIADVQCRLRLGPRHNPPITDDAVLTVGYHSGSTKSALLSRARATELRDWLNVWLEHGWDGVPQEDGESTADTIDHFRDIAVRYQVERDRARCDANRQVDAALALIPAELRTVDLAKVAAAQSELWHRRQAEIDGLKQFRVAVIGTLFDLERAAGNLTADKAITYLRKTVDKFNHPKVPANLPTTDAPIYEQGQLNFDVEAAA